MPFTTRGKIAKALQSRVDPGGKVRRSPGVQSIYHGPTPPAEGRGIVNSIEPPREVVAAILERAGREW